MTPEITLGAIVLAPVVVIMLLRINAVLVFLSLCLGDVLVQFVAPDAQSFLDLLSNSRATDPITASDSTIALALLLVPVVITAVVMIRTIKGHTKLLMNLLPAAGVGLLGALLVVPLLSSGLSDNITTSDLWIQMQKAQNLIVGGSALICLLVLWANRPKSSHEEKGKKH